MCLPNVAEQMTDKLTSQGPSCVSVPVSFTAQRTGAFKGLTYLHALKSVMSLGNKAVFFSIFNLIDFLVPLSS